MNQFKCARSCLAAGYFMSLGTPTLSRRYASDAAVSLPAKPFAEEPPGLPSDEEETRQEETVTPGFAPSALRSSAHTLRSAASTAGTCASSGVAVGSDSGAATGGTLAHPRAAN